MNLKLRLFMGLSIMLAMDQSPDSNFTAKCCELNIIKDIIGKRSYVYGGKVRGC
jgi:hypothetical protein